MARKNQVMSVNNLNEKADTEKANVLGEAFEALLESKFGYARAPSPIVTPFGIAHLDALLGGGITSSSPVMFSSTPETGKSTLAFQLMKNFQEIHPNSVGIYIDIETAGNSLDGTDPSSEYQRSRFDLFKIDVKRFKYEPLQLNIKEVFDLIESIVNVKKAAEEKTGKEFYVLIIWDSLAATPSGKIQEVEDHNSLIGYKARELSFCMDKYSSLIALNRVTFVTIDQTRANLKIEGRYVSREKSVGEFKDYKAATNIMSFNHKVQQWIFLSKKKVITPADGMGLDGWYIDVYTEKCKRAPSGYAVRCVFDKKFGLNKFWSEYVFLSELTPTEEKIYRNKKFPYHLPITGKTKYTLEVVNPETGEVWTSDSFYRRNAYKLYCEDEQFRNAFDYAVEQSVKERIIEGMFRLNVNEILDEVPDPEKIEEFGNVEIEEPSVISNNTTINDDTNTSESQISNQYSPVL